MEQINTSNRTIEQFKEALPAIECSSGESNLARFSRDESSETPVEPDFVVFPKNAQEVSEIVRYAAAHGIPLTPYGAGSSLEGHAIPVEKGIVLSFDYMNQVVEFLPEDLIVKVQPGVTRKQLNEKINSQGLYFPIDPGADASIGGMCATNASGTTAVRYGSMRDQVLDLEVVLPNGSIIHTGTMAKKSSSGYHLNGLFIGSEGTLGIITEITLKLHGIPEHIVAAVCTFDTPKESIDAAQIVLQSGVPVLRMEYVDDVSIRQINAYGDYNIPEKHSLFFEFAGSKLAAEEAASMTEELMKDLGANNWHREDDSKKRAELWKARHEISYAFSHTPGLAKSSGDVCVPISKLSDLIVYTREMIEESGLLGAILGHVGDGNFHTIVMYRQDDPREVELAEDIKDKMTYKAIELGGTCTGEHGVGIAKRKYQQVEHGEAFQLMKDIKQLLDPTGILNPGKIFE